MTRKRSAYECTNPKCRSKRLRLISPDARLKSGRGNQQLVYECQDCGWKAGEMALERARIRRELGGGQITYRRARSPAARGSRIAQGPRQLPLATAGQMRPCNRRCARAARAG